MFFLLSLGLTERGNLSSGKVLHMPLHIPAHNGMFIFAG